MNHNEINDYEQSRLNNIKRNKQRLQELGVQQLTDNKLSSKRVKRQHNNNHTLPTRRSNRINNQQYNSNNDYDNDIDNDNVNHNDKPTSNLHKTTATSTKNSTAIDENSIVYAYECTTNTFTKHIKLDITHMTNYIGHIVNYNNTAPKTSVLYTLMNNEEYIKPRYNKYSGHCVFHNCIILYCNIDMQNNYNNVFTMNNDYIEFIWYANEMQSSNAPLIQRFIKYMSNYNQNQHNNTSHRHNNNNDIAAPTGFFRSNSNHKRHKQPNNIKTEQSADNDNNDVNNKQDNNDDTVLLFVRFSEQHNQSKHYVYCGESQCIQVNTDNRPISTRWKLLSTDRLLNSDEFMKLYNYNQSS